MSVTRSDWYNGVLDGSVIRYLSVLGIVTGIFLRNIKVTSLYGVVRAERLKVFIHQMGWYTDIFVILVLVGCDSGNVNETK